jgi:hypothetical protein
VSARNAAVLSDSHEEAAQAGWAADAEAIHQWYRIIMGFDWKLADSIIDALSVCPGEVVLDPFCGAGTTLVQCKKREIEAVGLDVNPVCTLATKVKTTWALVPDTLNRLLGQIVLIADSEKLAFGNNSALQYLQKSGMIERGWLSLHKAKIVLAIRAAIRSTQMSGDYRNFFYLALVSAVVSRIADIKFGPEVYCLAHPRRLPAMASFVDVAEMMIDDMDHARGLRGKSTSSRVAFGDARSVESLRDAAPHGVNYLITSPPYPNEHDYTRSTRLELVVLGHVSNVRGLQTIKRNMVRCTTKGVYRGDSDAAYSNEYTDVDDVARVLDRRARKYSDGFSKLYGRMVREYFGGMACHLKGVMQILRPGGRCAYVVRDTQSLLGVYIDTPGILAKIAGSPEIGFQLEELIEWKRVKGTTGVRMLSEKIIMLRKPRR